MNIFYAKPEQISGNIIELTGQEATHASKVLRHQPGDLITATDGQGGWFEGTIRQVNNKSIQIEIKKSENRPRRNPRIVLGLGILKKRDRLEFAVEKAVELGATAIVLFRSEHTVKENVRIDRLESVALSAMKQSLQAWLPEIRICNSVNEVVEYYPDFRLLVAHEKADAEPGVSESLRRQDKLLLLVGPEGGFSESEVEVLMQNDGRLVSLGTSRLRTETAAVTFLSQFI